MIERSESRNPIELLAEEFTERRRRGDRPTVAEYVDEHPELADEIRELFPMIVAMERVKTRVTSSGDRPLELRVDKLEQLGDFRILREVGRGGMGIVYEAEQQSLGRRVAVKVFPRQALGDSKQLQRFRREARTAALLHHSNIVQVFGVGDQDSLSYYVMQLIRGVSLDQVLGELKKAPARDRLSAAPSEEPTRAERSDQTRAGFTAEDAARAVLDGEFPARDADGELASVPAATDPNETDRSGPTRSSVVAAAGSAGRDSTTRGAVRRAVASANGLSARSNRSGRYYWQSVARIGVQVGEALRYAHSQGTLHRDIKPSNLLLDPQGTVWVTDFGLAKAVAQEQLSQSGDIVGTLRYMAPEQLRGGCDSRCDVYSLGLTLYELLTLRPAFVDSDQNRLVQRVLEGEPTRPRSLRPEIPRDLETIVLKAVARDPQHRYQTAGELVDDLRRFLHDRPIRARRVSPLERLWRWSRRNPTVAALSAVLLLVVMGSFAAISWKWRETDVEKKRAQEESLRAETNLSLALDSMDQFLDHFESAWMAHPGEPQGEDGEADVGVRMAVSESTAAVLEEALRFYHQFAELNALNPRLQRDTANAYRRVGDIHRRLGQCDKAESAYRRAAAIYTAQSQHFPNDADLATLTAVTLNELGLVLDTVGRIEEARTHFDRARRVLSAELQRSPGSGECRYELARIFSNLGGVSWRLMRPMEAARNHRRAKELLEELAEEHPQKAEYRLALARAYRVHVPFDARDKRGRDAAWYRSEAILILEELVEDFPLVPDYQCELSETLTMPSGPFRRPESPDKLELRMRRAVDLARRITDEYPRIPRYRAALASSVRGLGRVFRGSRRDEEAEPLFREAAAIYRTLREEFPSIHAYQFFLAMALHAHGDVLRELDLLDESRRVLEEAISEQQAYVNSQAEAVFARRTLAQQHGSLAWTLEQLGQDREAALARQEAEAIRSELEQERRSRQRR